jgi:hypothetical protein
MIPGIIILTVMFLLSQHSLAEQAANRREYSKAKLKMEDESLKS